MSRVGVFLVLLVATAGVLPRSGYCQVSPANGVTTAGEEARYGRSAAELLAPPANSLTLLPVRSATKASKESARPPGLLLPQARNRRGVPFMVTGGVLFLAGAIIGNDGGTILMIGGAVVGAYGTYVYFGG